MKSLLIYVLAFFATLLFLSFTGCIRKHVIKPVTSSGENVQGTYFDIDMVNVIVDNKTTLSEIEIVFGKPFTISTDGNSFIHTYFYSYNKYSSKTIMYSVSMKMDGFTRLLSVIYDKNDVVEKHNFSETPIKVDLKGN